MIPVNTTILQTASWQEQLRDMVRDGDELLRLLRLDSEAMPDVSAALRQFPLRVPRHFVGKMRPGDWQDPLLLQVLPQSSETDLQPGFVDDPLEERHANPAPGLIHKYRGRVLMITTPACAVHCRYCFRRNFPYQDNNPSRAHWQQALDYISARPDIGEVILSGGDPLSASDDYLAELIERIATIPHVHTLRLHSRLPVVLPARITPSLVEVLTGHRMQTVLVIHSNHPNELDDDTAEALQRMRQAGVTLLNQSVLLKGINDDADTLVSLSERLFQCQTLPYYLHLLDKVSGAGHFECSEEVARQLRESLLARLPGYLVPRLVREDAGASSKTPIAI